MIIHRKDWDTASKGIWMPDEIRDLSQEKITRMTILKYNDQPIPVLFMRYPDGTFRSRITEDTRVTIIMDIVSVFPIALPICFIMPVVFDDLSDPFWSFLTLSLFPVGSVYGVEHVYMPNGNPLAPREMFRLASKTNRCGVIILNNKYDVLKSEVITLNCWDEERPDEIEEVLKFIYDHDLNFEYAQYQSACEIFEEQACFQVPYPDGIQRFLPKNRWPVHASKNIFPLKLSHGRLVNRHEDVPDQTNKQYDIFISYAHVDYPSANSISDWILSIWPQLKIFIADPNSSDAYEEDPMFFIKAAQSSSLILLVISPNSIYRPMVQFEIASRYKRQMLTVLVGGITTMEFEDLAKNSIFVNYDINNVIEIDCESRWTDLVKKLARIFSLIVPDQLPTNPTIKIKQEEYDFRKLEIGYEKHWTDVDKADTKYQTTDKARNKLLSILDELSGKGIDPEHVKTLKTYDPKISLLYLLLHWKEKDAWRVYYELVPALFTKDLVTMAANSLKNFSGTLEEKQRMVKIHDFIASVVESPPETIH